jgi:hypothetical protein
MVTALSKTDGSLGRVKNTLPDSNPSPDLDYYETAAEHERQKDALIEHANALNEQAIAITDLEASLGSVSGAVLYDMPISTASVGTPRRLNTAGGAFTDTSKSASVVASRSMPGRNVLRLAATVQGGWMWPLQGLPALPAEGYILDVEIDEAGNSGGGIPVPSIGFVDLVSPGGSDTVAGLQLMTGAIGFIQPSVIPLGAGFSNPSSPFVTLSPWATSPTPTELNKATVRLVVEFRRQASQTPAQWSVAATCYPTDSQVRRVAVSGVSHPQAALNGRPLSTIALGMWNDSGSAGAANLSIARLLVKSLT